MNTELFFSSGFAPWAAVMLILTLVFIVLPLLRRDGKAAPNVDQNTVNIDVLRDDLAELTRDHQAGILTSADFAQAREELLKRCLSEESAIAQPNSGAAKSRPAITLAIWLIAVIPLTTLLLYFYLGRPEALNIAAIQARASAMAEQQQQQIDRSVDELAQRLSANPDDLRGWRMLAHSYKTMRRFKESAEAFAKVSELAKDDPGALADYAESLYWAEGEVWSGKTRQLLQQALALDGQHVLALLLSAAAARSQGDNNAAIGYWRRLQEQVEPGSEEASTLQQAIDKALAEEKVNPKNPESSTEESQAGTQ